MTTVPDKLAADATKAAPLRVMVVDDSLVMRGIISRMIREAGAGFEVVASVQNGAAAVERARQRDLDVVVLDVEMPVLDGLAALPQLLAIDPDLVVIMASSLTTRNAQISLKALSAGAKDYVPKPSTSTPGDALADFRHDLIEKIRELGTRFRRKSRRAPIAALGAVRAPPPPAPVALRSAGILKPDVLAIGSSTGGPTALVRVLKDLPRPIRLPVLITQHMPPTFTALLAENLTRDCGLPASEATNGEPLRPGKVYIAPGDHHMTVAMREGQPTIVLNQEPKENFCRPAVDPMVRSLVQTFGRNILLTILTGMGQDGLVGARAVVQAGGTVVAQDEASSVVWGMPGAVAKAGLCSAVLPLGDIGKHLGGLMGR
jgi:two-component system chemotaxis response regulator CheB